MGESSTVVGRRYLMQNGGQLVPARIFGFAQAKSTDFLNIGDPVSSTAASNVNGFVNSGGYVWYGDNTGSYGGNCANWTGDASTGGAINTQNNTWGASALSCLAQSTNVICVAQTKAPLNLNPN